MRWLVGGAFAALALPACTDHQVLLDIQAPATLSSEPAGYESAVVTRVVDGDTIVVRLTGTVDGPGAGTAHVAEEYRVRLVGIDAPESVRPGTPVECFGREASAAARALLDGQPVRLVKDVEETDSFDRLLRYVYIGDEMANARLVINGYAFAYTYPPNVRHANLFVDLQRQAQRTGVGLWSSGACPEGDESALGAPPSAALERSIGGWQIFHSPRACRWWLYFCSASSRTSWSSTWAPTPGWSTMGSGSVT